MSPNNLASGLLSASGGHQVYWETTGNPNGKPALVLHGGPGSGCRPGHRRLFDPDAYHIILMDQRGCGRSRPLAATSLHALDNNTTQDLLDDIETLRAHLGVDTWLIFGGSWGSTLALKYAQTHPRAVSELVLAGVATTARRDLQWLYGDVGNMFPEAYNRFSATVPNTKTPLERIVAYGDLLTHTDPDICQQAADNWCRWELAMFGQDYETVDLPGWSDPAFRLTFARIVTHYFRNAAWLDDTEILNNMGRIAHIPGVMIHSRFDPSAPLRAPWELAQAWPMGRLQILPGNSHSAVSDEMTMHIRAAMDAFRPD